MQHQVHYIGLIDWLINSLAPGICTSNFKSMILKLITQNSSLGTCCECHRTSLMKSTLFLVKAPLPEAMLTHTYAITSPRWVNPFFLWPVCLSSFRYIYYLFVSFRKFICLNDNLDHTKEHAQMVRTIELQFDVCYVEIQFCRLHLER